MLQPMNKYKWTLIILLFQGICIFKVFLQKYKKEMQTDRIRRWWACFLMEIKQK